MLLRTLRRTHSQLSRTLLSSASRSSWSKPLSSSDRMIFTLAVWSSFSPSIWVARVSFNKLLMPMRMRHMAEHQSGILTRWRGSEAILLLGRPYHSRRVPQGRCRGSKRSNLQMLHKQPVSGTHQGNHSRARILMFLHYRVKSSRNDFHTVIRNMIGSTQKRTLLVQTSQI